MTPGTVRDPWHDTLITELRLAEVPGERIGETLAEVEAFCADSGQTPGEAFGDARAYAREVIGAHAGSRPAGPHRVLIPVAQMFATLVGAFAVLNAVAALTGGTAARITVGELVTVGLGTASFPFVLRLVFHPGLLRRRWAWAAVVGSVPLVLAVPAVLWRQVAQHPPARALLAGGLFLLAAAWWPVLSNRVFADRIVDPRTGGEMSAPPRLLIAVVRWSLPALLLIAVIVAVALR